jgi:MOSC domain-containing protein YiiM
MSPRVIGLFTAAGAGAPVDARSWVDLLPGVGIVGDRYALGCGHWSAPQWPDQELTFVEAEVAEAVGIDPAQLRRNVVTRDIRLDEVMGARFQIGDAVLVGIRPCDPCRYLESLTRPGLAQALVGRGGLRARILQGGRFQVGDSIMVLPPPT